MHRKYEIYKKISSYKTGQRNRAQKMRSFPITYWDWLNVYKAKWYELKARDFEDDPESYVIGDLCDFADKPKTDQSKPSRDNFFIDFNPKYVEELREITTALKNTSKICSVVILFRLDPDRNIEGVFTVDDFMEKLVNHKLLFNVGGLLLQSYKLYISN